MSEQTVAARDLLPGDVVHGAWGPHPRQVTSAGREGGMIAITYDHSGVPLLYDPDARLTAVSDASPPAPVTAPTDPRDDVIAAARALVASWSGPYPAGIDPEAVIGGCEGDLDGALARLDAVQHSRSDTPEQAATSCPAGVACTGRDGSPSPYACSACGHCAEHGDGGCAARKSNDVRCGCTGGGAS